MLALAGFIIVSLVRRETVERWGWRIPVWCWRRDWCCAPWPPPGTQLPPVGPECHRRLGGGGAVQRQERSVRYLLYLCGAVSFSWRAFRRFSYLHQTYRFWVFAVLSAAFTVKVLTIEVSRVILHLQG